MIKRILSVIAAALLAILLFIGTSPVRAIKAAALLSRCSWTDVIRAEFQETDRIGRSTAVYRTDAGLLDPLTGSGHSVWYVHRLLFLYIPEWAGNG